MRKNIDVDSLLSQLALDRYKDLFSQLEVDTEALAMLYADDLRERGLPPGPRKKILAALEQRVSNANDMRSIREDVTAQPDEKKQSVLPTESLSQEGKKKQIPGTFCGYQRVNGSCAIAQRR